MKKYSRKYVYDERGKLFPLGKRTYKTNEGYDCILIDGGSKNGYVTVKIKEYIFEAQANHIRKGVVKYPFHPSTFGKGYLGIGKYKASENGKNTKVYALWSSILCRAYDIEFHKTHPTYKGVEVCKGWYNFQNFADWFYNKSNYQEGWALDKDLLSRKDKKIYSPQTCVFVPQAFNLFLTNKQANNTSGCIGVHWNTRDKKWVACINIIEAGKCKHLGYFDDIEEATNAYKNEREKYAQIWKSRMRGILPNAVVERIK